MCGHLGLVHSVFPKVSRWCGDRTSHYVHMLISPDKTQWLENTSLFLTTLFPEMSRGRISQYVHILNCLDRARAERKKRVAFRGTLFSDSRGGGEWSSGQPPPPPPPPPYIYIYIYIRG